MLLLLLLYIGVVVVSYHISVRSEKKFPFFLWQKKLFLVDIMDCGSKHEKRGKSVQLLQHSVIFVAPFLLLLRCQFFFGGVGMRVRALGVLICSAIT